MFKIPKNYRLISSTKESVSIYYKEHFVQTVEVKYNPYVLTDIKTVIKMHQKDAFKQ